MQHNLFYVDNTSQVRGGLQGTLSKEVKKGLVGVPVLNFLSEVGGSTLFIEQSASICAREI